MLVAHPRQGDPPIIEVIKTEEKGSDVNLATHLLLDGCRKACRAAVVISNDSDLKEPVELAQSELGLKVGIINPHPAAHRSRALRPTFFKQVRTHDLKLCQFPEGLHDVHGAIHKPGNW